jgi:hypothetical protein
LKAQKITEKRMLTRKTATIIATITPRTVQIVPMFIGPAYCSTMLHPPAARRTRS